MKEFRLFGVCKGCRRKRLFISQRMVKLPIGLYATSQDMFCQQCYRKLQALIENKYERRTRTTGVRRDSLGPQGQPPAYNPPKRRGRKLARLPSKGRKTKPSKAK